MNIINKQLYIPEEIVRHILSFSDEPLLLGVSLSTEEIENDLIYRDTYRPKTLKGQAIIARRSYHLGRIDICISILKDIYKHHGNPEDCMFFISRISDDDIDVDVLNTILKNMNYMYLCGTRQSYPLEYVTSYIGSKAIHMDNHSLLVNMINKGASYDTIAIHKIVIDNDTYRYVNNKMKQQILYYMAIIMGTLTLFIFLLCYIFLKFK
jgi:hypothetical protein